MDNDIEKNIKKIYKNISGFGLKKEGKLKDNQNVFITYGEILPESVTKIKNYLKINKDDVIYDLGSGVGKLCVQLFLQTDAKKVSGIEIVEKRHNSAELIKKKINEAFPIKFKNRNLEFLNIDITNADLSDATIVYMCSTCFSDNFLNLVVNKIKDNKNLRAIISMKKLPNNINNLPIMEVIDTPCTWSNNTKAYVYKKQN